MQFLQIPRSEGKMIQSLLLKNGNGFSIRVDHRTLKAQKEETEKNGDIFLARLLSRVPEEYVGVISCKEYDAPKTPARI